MENRLHVGIDFSRDRADLCLLSPEGETIVRHRTFPNSPSGYAMARELITQTLETHGYQALDISAEATANYWMPYYWQFDADLAGYDCHLFVLEPRWVRWYKHCHSEDHKKDRTDPFYIADRTRALGNCIPWHADLHGWRLRTFTRLRFHLTQALIHEKGFLRTHLFLRASGYVQEPPLSDIFGHTSRAILARSGLWSQLDTLSDDEVAASLDQLSGHRLRDPRATAAKLRRAHRNSFRPPIELEEPLQEIWDLGIDHLSCLEALIDRLDKDIAREAQAYPGARCLATIPGFGLVLASGIAAEIGNLGRFCTPLKPDRRGGYRPRNLRDVEDAVAKFAGLWWPESSSGHFVAEERRLSKRGNRYLRYHLILGADALRRYVPKYQEFYARKHREANRHKHWRALVLTARQSVGLIVGLLHRNEPWRSEEG